MDWITAVGLLAATCTTAAFLPQVIKTINTKQTKDISLLMYIVFVIGVAAWLIYGIFIDKLPIILANAVTLLLTSWVLILKIKYH